MLLVAVARRARYKYLFWWNIWSQLRSRTPQSGPSDEIQRAEQQIIQLYLQNYFSGIIYIYFLTHTRTWLCLCLSSVQCRLMWRFWQIVWNFPPTNKFSWNILKNFSLFFHHLIWYIPVEFFSENPIFYSIILTPDLVWHLATCKSYFRVFRCGRISVPRSVYNSKLNCFHLIGFTMAVCLTIQIGIRQQKSNEKEQNLRILRFSSFFCLTTFYHQTGFKTRHRQ